MIVVPSLEHLYKSSRHLYGIFEKTCLKFGTHQTWIFPSFCSSSLLSSSCPPLQEIGCRIFSSLVCLCLSVIRHGGVAPRGDPSPPNLSRKVRDTSAPTSHARTRPSRNKRRSTHRPLGDNNMHCLHTFCTVCTVI